MTDPFILSPRSSPGHITTNQTLPLLAAKPELGRAWADANPLGRLGEIHELRGVVAWLASSASSFATGSDILVSGACSPYAWPVPLNFSC